MSVLLIIWVVLGSLILIWLIAVALKQVTVWSPLPKETFLAAVQAACQPLVECGFTQVEASQQFVTYQRKLVKIAVWQDKGGELPVLVTHDAIVAQIPVQVLGQYLKHQDPIFQATVYCSDQGSAERFLSTCITFLVNDGQDWLYGDLEAYQRLEEFYRMEY